MDRARPNTDMYLAAVERAVRRPGEWIEVPRRFETEFNAKMTGSCLRGGYLRVQPRRGDQPITMNGKRYIATAAPVTTRVEPAPKGGWRLEIRVDR